MSKKKRKKAKEAAMTLPAYQRVLAGLQDPPWVAGSATSHAAAEEIEPDAPKLREVVFNAILDDGPLTDEQIADVTGLNPSTCRPRRVELARAGRIAVVGYSKTRAGRKAQAWEVVV